MNAAACPPQIRGLAAGRGGASMPPMSRRSRRRRETQAGGSWLARAVLGLIVLGLLAAALLYAAVRGYLHSEGFRRLLSEKVSAAAGVNGQFTPFRWDGLVVETAAFQATGEGPVRELRLDGLHTEVGLGGLRRGVWEIRDAHARRVEISLDAAAGAAFAVPGGFPPAEEQPVPAVRRQEWLPREVELQGLELGDVTLRAQLEQGPFTASGIRVALKPDGGRRSYRIEAAGGVIQSPLAFLPLVRLDEARLRYRDGAVFVTRLSAGAWEKGLIEASGEWDRHTRRFAFEGDLTGVKCEEVLSETWAKRLTGDLGTDFSTDNHSGGPAARGRLVLKNGTLTALPVLDVLAAYADTRRFRVMALSEAHADWKWEKDQLVLSDIVFASEGLARLEGRIVIRGRELDGVLRLGLMPGSLASIPGAETHVFSPGERGLLWAPLHLTGTLDKPREDLSDRLIAAAGLRMLETLPETGEQVIKFTRGVISGQSTKAVEKGVEIIGKTGLGVREVGGILDSLLGGDAREEPEPKPEPRDDEAHP